MGNPQLRNIESIDLYNFTSTPYVRIEWWQQHKGKRYYRLKLTKYSGFSPAGFPTTYLYLGPYETVPNYYYTASFAIKSVKNSSLVNTSFEALFTQYSNTSTLRVMVELQSSTSSSFSSYETSTDSRWVDISLKGEGFGPIWSCPTWFDNTYASNTGVRTLTGSNQKGLQGISYLIFTFAQATARYGTSVEKYSINITGGFSDTLTASQVASGTREYLELAVYYKLVGNVTVTFTVEDSRGMRTSFTRTITIVPYKKLYLTNNDTHRQGGTGSTVVFDFAGNWYGSPLTLTCIGITAKEEGSSATYATLTPSITVSGTSFSYKSVWSGVSFDPEKAYTITAKFTDTVKTVTVTLPVPIGTPVLSIRDKRVGVNNASPTYSLDVDGIIAQNGYPSLGYVGLIGDSDSANLNNYTDTGYYIYKAGDSRDVSNFPGSNINTHLLMMVICAQGYKGYKYGIQKAWWPTTGDEYTRTFYAGSFTSWKKVTIT